MSLLPGTRLGIYQVVELIGVGGMGEVYRARDTRLDRDVALKVLPDLFSVDHDRLARFEREAKVLASLNHPHIASIYGIEVDGVAPALAMEMVEGPTLAERLQQGPLPIDEAIAIARQIAEGLEHAHEKGIVHRDLKPANVKITPAGSVKVLDFGLARAMISDSLSGSAPSAVSSPTITSPVQMTRAGVILGTAAYMSPEQARGKVVDQRADVWAFGCVLYEMLTGQRPFAGVHTADVLARVIERDPDWNALPAATPGALKTLMQRCLRKDPARRIHSIADVRLDLEEITPGGEEQLATPSRSNRGLAFLGAGLVGAAAAAALLWTLAPRTASEGPALPMRFAIHAPDGWSFHRQIINGTPRLSLAVSPDGRKLAAVMTDKNRRRQVWVRRFDQPSFVALPETERTIGVFWAPDSDRLGFFDNAALRYVSITGGVSRAIAEVPNVASGSWEGDDGILVGLGANALRKYSIGGTYVEASERGPATAFQGAGHMLANGAGYIYLHTGARGRMQIKFRPAAGPESLIADLESVALGSARAEYRSGYMLVSRMNQAGQSLLTAQRFDPTRGTLAPESLTIASNLDLGFSASEGVLVYGDDTADLEGFDWLDLKGQTLSRIANVPRTINFDLSPDERFVAIQAPQMLFVHDLARGVTAALGMPGTDPIWSPDGTQIAYTQADIRSVAIVPAFGGAPKIVFRSEDSFFTEDWSRDGKWLAGIQWDGNNRLGLLVPVDGGAPPVEFAREVIPRAVDETRISPDGRWIAYSVINGVDAEAAFLVPNPPTGERWQISAAGGAQPRWRADGRAIYFLAPSGTLMMTEVKLQPGKPPDVGAPRNLFETNVVVRNGTDQFSVGRSGGGRFLFLRSAESVETRSVHVVLNWPALLDKKP